MAAYQGTLALIRAAVIRNLRLDDEIDVDAVDEAINLAYQEAVQETGCLQLKADADLTADVNSYDLPAEVLWIRYLVVTYSDGTISDPLRQVTLEQLLEQRRATLAGGQSVVRPWYALAGQNQLEIWPDPGTGQSMTFWYVYQPGELTADDDEPLIQEPYGSKLLTYGASVEMARFKQDLLLLGDMETAYARWLSRFQVWLNRREGQSAQTFRVRGGQTSLRFANPSVDTLR